MQFSSLVTSDESPYTLQVAIPTAKTDSAVTRSIQSLAVLADRASQGNDLQAQWWDQHRHKRTINKVRMLAPDQRQSPDRVQLLTDHVNDDAFDFRIESWDWKQLEERRIQRSHFVASGIADHSILADHISYIAFVAVRFENVVREQMSGWKTFSRAAVSAVAQTGAIRCGSIDIIPSYPFMFGDAFVQDRPAQSLLRATLWSRWVNAAAAGDDAVPWPSHGMILSAAAIAKAGGEARLAEDISAAAGPPDLRNPLPHFEMLPCGNAIVWPSPKFEWSLPRRDPDDQLNMDALDGPRTAAIYRVLERAGIAL